MALSLAVKYRPKTFDDVTEQEEVKKILEWQISNNDIKGAYLFVGGAGTGKTTSARIFANEINHGVGNPVELDAASNNGVDDVREIAQQAQMKSLTGEYKVFILDEVHMFSQSAWNALLKLLEEPPQKTVFIMCTTDPQKIPKTILSRAQRYQFNRISQQGIKLRLSYVLSKEQIATVRSDALDYIAKTADGHMRDALTMLDKCLAYSHELTVENVVKAIGATDYETMIRLSKALLSSDTLDMITIVDKIHNYGKDFKLFVRSYLSFILDVCTYELTKNFDFIKIPNIYESDLKFLCKYEVNELLKTLVKLNSEIKYDSEPKILAQAYFYQFCMRIKNE